MYLGKTNYCLSQDSQAKAQLEQAYNILKSQKTVNNIEIAKCKLLLGMEYQMLSQFAKA